MLVTPKDFDEINQEFLNNLIINKIQENYHLDYKGRRVGSNNEIAKDISSFANSDGGNIIYGLEEGEHIPKQITPLDASLREKFDLIAKDGIDPPLTIRVCPIEVGVNEEKGFVYVIYIPKKYPRIYQAKGYGKYYKRTEFTSSPMSNTEIEQAFKLYLTYEKELDDNIKLIERSFLGIIGSKKNFQRSYSTDSKAQIILSTFLIINPVDFSKEIFNDNEKMIRFLSQTSYFNARKSDEIFEGKPIIRQDDYIYISDDSDMLKNLMIHKDGITIYNFRYLLQFANKDDVENNLKLNLVYLANYYIGFFDFIHNLFQLFNYFGNISISLKIEGISSWDLSDPPSKSQQVNLNPVKTVCNLDELKIRRLKILKNLYDPVLNAYGRTIKDAEFLFKQIKQLL